MRSLSRDRWGVLALLAILLLAVGLRLYRLDHQSLWNDEGTSVALAQRDLVTITRNAAHDIHPPLYYYLLHCWVGLVGTSEFAVRSLSVLGGVSLVAGAYHLGKRLFGAATAILAALFVAMSPFYVYYSQETRMYIFASLFGLLSVLSLDHFLDDWAQKEAFPFPSAAIYALTCVLAIYSHYFAFTILLAQNIAFSIWLVRDSRGRRETRRPWWRIALQWVAIQAIVLLCYLPWLVLSWSSLQSWPAISAPFSPADLLRKIVRVFPLGVTVDESRRNLLVGAALSLLIFPAAFSRTRIRDDLPLGDRFTSHRPNLHAWLAILYLAVPIIALYGLSLKRPMYKPKFLLVAAPAYQLLQARGIIVLGHWARRATKMRWGQIAVAVGLTLVVCAVSAYSLVGLYANEIHFRDDYRGIVAYIDAHAGPQDAILINAPSQIETVDYYYHGGLAEYPLPAQRPIDTAKTEANLEEIVARHHRLYAIFWATKESDPEGFIESWLDQRCFKTLDSWFGNVRLVVYAVPQAIPGEIEHPTDYVLGEKIRLRGYTCTPEPRSGDILQLTLFWEALTPIGKRYKVFTHIVDARGNIVAQRDSEPGGGGRLTSDWRTGELISDNYGLLLPPGTPPGEHILRVGLYGLEDGQRLSVTRAGQGMGDAIDLARLTVQPAESPPPIAALDMQHSDDASWGSLHLIGHSLHRLGYEHQPDAPLRPGDVARLTLFWHKHEGAMAGEGFVIALVDQKGRPTWEQSLQVTGSTFSLDQWRDGEIVRDIHQLPLPDSLPPDTYRLTLRAADGGESDPYILEKVTIK